jgi:hypothetical protein
MNTNEFWNIIESAQAEDPDPNAVAATVQSTLEGMLLEEVVEFNRELNQRQLDSFRWDLWAVAYIVNGGCSDDGFAYFRAWLITKGRAYFEAAMGNPLRAADEAGFDENECEEMLYVASSVYHEMTGNYPEETGVEFPESPLGEPWEEDEVESLYPELNERFG